MNALCMEECGSTCHCLWATGVQVKTDFHKGDLLHSGHSCHIPSRNWAMCWFSFPLPIADSRIQLLCTSHSSTCYLHDSDSCV